MRIKNKFYFQRKVTAAVLNDLQDVIEEAINRVMVDRGMRGLFHSDHVVTASTGFKVSISSGVSDSLLGTTRLGKRVALSAEPYVTDDLSTVSRTGGSFTLPGSGNEKWITLVLRASRTLSQPEYEKIPPTTTLYYFVQTEAFEIGVLQGSEVASPAGSGDKPSLAAEDGIYLCDILLENGITDFTTSTIEINRKQVDAIAEAYLRGLDGVDEKIAFVGDVGGANFVPVYATIASQAIGGASIDTGNQLVDLTSHVVGSDVPKYWVVQGLGFMDAPSPSAGHYFTVLAAAETADLDTPSMAVAQTTAPSLVAGAGLNVFADNLSRHCRNNAWVPVGVTSGPAYNIAYRMAYANGGPLGASGLLGLYLRGYIK